MQRSSFVFAIYRNTKLTCITMYNVVSFKIYIILKEQMFSDFDYFYEIIRSTKKDYIDTGNAAKKFLDADMKEKFKVFQRYISAASDARTMLSERSQDPEWFEGRYQKRR